jgi:type VI secretion system protein ImpJ
LLPPVFAPYNHRDLCASFAPLEAFIMRMLDEGIPEAYAAFPFVWIDGLFRLPFDGSWMERRLVLAVRVQVGMSELDVIAWMEECLIGASTVMPSLVDRRIRGAERQVLQRDDDLIPARGVVLFTLTVDAAFIVANETLDIVNTSERWGGLRPAEIVLYVKHTT